MTAVAFSCRHPRSPLTPSTMLRMVPLPRCAAADVVFLSFSDSDLNALARAYDSAPEPKPTLRLASLAALRHPYSIDLYLERVCAHTKFIVARVLGGADYWRYGVDELAALARKESSSPFCRATGAPTPGSIRPRPLRPTRPPRSGAISTRAARATWPPASPGSQLNSARRSRRRAPCRSALSAASRRRASTPRTARRGR